MKILFINISDIHGGAAKSMWRIAEQLEKMGNEIKFIVRSKYSNSQKVIEVGRNRYTNILFNLLGLQYKFLPASWKVVKEARKFKPDVISLNQIEGGYFQTRDLIKLTKIAPVFWTMHDLWSFMGNSHRELLNGEKEKNVYPQIGLPTSKWLSRQKKKIYDKCEFKTILPSRYLRDKYLRSITDKEFGIIPHGVDLDKFKPSKTKRILFIAEKTSKGKLHEILLSLDELLTFKICLTIIGDGKFDHKYKNIIIEKKGYIEDENELIYHYRDADIFIHPTQADNCPLTLIEAMACGLPCISYAVGGVPEIITNGYNGYLIKPFNSYQFAYKIWMLLTDRFVRENFSDNARKTAVEKFNIEQVAKQYLKFYKTEVV